MALQLPAQVSLVEVAARDGFQNEAEIIPTDKKIAFIDRLSAAGFRDIEIGSFVSPKWIPQLADTRAVWAGIQKRPGTRYWTLVPNRRGLESALGEGVNWIACFMSVSESHNRNNVNRSVAESLKDLREVIGVARDAGIEVRGYLSTVFGCPYEGPVDVERVVALSDALLEAGANELSLGDTIGAANPKQVIEVVSRLEKAVPLSKLALHFHDTRGSALANVLAGLQAGITRFDASMGGIGGCPYAPGASGNLATEDLVHMLTAMGIDAGVSLDDAAECGIFLRNTLGRPLPGRYHNYHLGQSRRRTEREARHGQPAIGG